jgi:hypothetical protein
MSILAIGDSNLYPSCTELNQPIDYTNLVPVFSQQMHRSFRCWSKNGASNFWIETHLEYFLADQDRNPNTLLFIGWTSTEREEWPWLYSNISVCGGPDFGIPAPMKARYEQWKSILTDEYMQQCIQFWHDRIYQIHLRLRDLNIAHLFWTTYDNFKSISHCQDWHGNFYKPYDQDGCMSKFFETNNILANDGDPFHYGAQAQFAWATELSNYAHRNNL